MRARALADRALLAVWVGAADSLDQAQQALAIARELDDPALLARALTACGFIAACYDAEVARDRTSPRRSAWPGHLDDRWRLSQILGLAGDARRSPRVTRSRRARPPKKDATSPTRSVTGSTRASAACASDWRSYIRVIWPEPSHNSARWPPRPRRLTMRSRG